MLLLIIIVASALSVSFLCSILEATLLSSSVVRLSRCKEQGDKGAALLLDLKENRINDAISAILTYNTIAHTVGAALSGAQAAVVFGDVGVGIFSGVLTLLILIFTEIIPKTIGTVHAGRLAGFSATVINLMTRPPMKWILYVTRALTRLIAREKHKRTTRGDVMAMLKMATRDGALNTEESRVLANLLKFEEVKVADVMTPRTVLAMFEDARTLEDALADRYSEVFSRIPVYEGVRDHVKGYVLMRELLRAAAEDLDPKTPVSTFLRPLTVVSEDLSVGKALQQFTRQGEHMAAVTDDMGVLAGVVTMEDLIETALGVEIVDEMDQVADLRKEAVKLRDRRMAQMRALRDEHNPPTPHDEQDRKPAPPAEQNDGAAGQEP